jgi:dipeptidyl aminopeptidase/acylaminoacyl peptidase
MEMPRTALFSCFALLLSWASASAQETAAIEPAAARSFDFELSIRSIMRGSEHVGEAPDSVSWTDDSRWIYFRWRPGGRDWSDTRSWYRVEADGGEPQELEESVADSLRVMFSGGDISPDRAWRATSVDGDLYLVDREALEAHRLTETVVDEREPLFSGDGRFVFFRKESNLYSISLSDGSARQLTDLREGPDPDLEDEDAEGQRAFLESQQQRLFENVRLQRQREEEQEARDERREASRPTPFYLGVRERVSGLFPSPDGAFVAVLLTTPPRDSRATMVPDWVTESGYTEDLTVRTKVGDAQSVLRIGLLEAATGHVSFLDVFGPDASECAREPRSWEREWTDSDGRRNRDEDTGGGRRRRRVEAPPCLAQVSFGGWNETGTHGMVFAVDFDYKEWRLYSVEASTGELTLLDSLRDEAWVGGPCFPGPRSGAGGLPACMGWVPERDRIFYVSEASGFARLLTVEPDGTDRVALTGDGWEVHSVLIPEDRSHFLIQTGEISPFDRHLFRMDFDGSNRELLVEGSGRFQGWPSPDGDRIALIHSRANRPPELFVAEYEADATLRQLSVSPTPAWLEYPWIEPPIIRFTAEDGASVPARIYRPSDFGVPGNGAGVVFVHGAGYTQNVHNGWSGYYREYMFHHFLASHGYTVLDIDYRGSAGHGRDWRTAAYRWMGGKDLSDQVDGARHLVEHEGVDPARVGVYGGSYGGFITLMALFTEPEVFEAGAALRSVTDWAHYNHWYTSRILNQPQEDESAYEKSSPIYFAEGFRGHLLIAHGMVDTNVHFSDVVRLAQRLIELGKERWEMAVYPVEGHGFQEPASWTDEYRRIFELFDRTIGDGVTAHQAGSPGGSESGRP